MTQIKILDCKGLESPQPLIETKTNLDALNTGDLLQVTVYSEGSIRNIRTLIANNAYKIVSFEQQGQTATFLIEK